MASKLEFQPLHTRLRNALEDTEGPGSMKKLTKQHHLQKPEVPKPTASSPRMHQECVLKNHEQNQLTPEKDLTNGRPTFHTWKMYVVVV